MGQSQSLIRGEFEETTENPLLVYFTGDNPTFSQLKDKGIILALNAVGPASKLDYLQGAYEALIAIDDKAHKPEKDEKEWPTEKYPLSPRQRQCIDHLQKVYVKVIEEVVNAKLQALKKDQQVVVELDDCLTKAQAYGGLVDAQTNTWQREIIFYTNTRSKICKKLRELPPQPYIGEPILETVQPDSRGAIVEEGGAAQPDFGNPVLDLLKEGQLGQYCNKQTLRLALHNTEPVAVNLAYIEKAFIHYLETCFNEIIKTLFGEEMLNVLKEKVSDRAAFLVQLSQGTIDDYMKQTLEIDTELMTTKEQEEEGNSKLRTMIRVINTLKKGFHEYANSNARGEPDAVIHAVAPENSTLIDCGIGENYRGLMDVVKKAAELRQFSNQINPFRSTRQ